MKSRPPAANFRGKKSRPKAKLGTPRSESVGAAVLTPEPRISPDSRGGYQHAIDEFCRLVLL